MTKAEKLLAKIRNNPKQVAFEDLDKLLRAFGYECGAPRGSHYHYTRPGSPAINVPYHRPHVKHVYVRLALATLDGLGE